MKKLTLDDYKKAGEEFWPKYEYISQNLSEESKYGEPPRPEAVLKVMEALAAVALKQKVEDKLAPFGFNKKENSNVSSN